MGVADLRYNREHAMSDGKDKDGQPATERQVSQRQARANAQAARDTRKSHREGLDDDSEIVESLVGTLAAPVEGTLDSMRERERSAARGEDLGATRTSRTTTRSAQRCRPSPKMPRRNRGTSPRT